MSIKKRFSSITILGVAVFIFAGLSIAQDAPKTGGDSVQKRQKREGRGFGRREHAGREMKEGRRGGFGFLRGIELTEAQREQIRAIREKNRPTDAEIQEIRAIRESHRAGSTLTDEQKTRLKTLHGERRAKAESVRQEIMAVLTAEQRQQLETRKAEFEKRREELRQKRQELREQRKQLREQRKAAKPTGN